MKKIAILLTLSTMLLSAGGASYALQPAAAEVDYSVEGGRFTVDFEKWDDYGDFALYTEFDKKPWQMDGAMYAWSLAEQKIILRGKSFEDVEVSVDISTINECGKFDSGIYVMASNVGSGMDAITAWNVNVEHGATNSTMDLKLHRFENGKWMGIKVEILGLPYSGDTVHLRVVVKDGMLYAFLNGKTTPTFTYEVGEGSGLVGLRNFYSPNYFDNFSVTGLANAVRTSKLDETKALATEELTKPLASVCKAELEAAIALAENAETQSQVDEAQAALDSALKRAVTARTYSELSELIGKAGEIENPDGEKYTGNSWNSFQAVKQICDGLTEESSEYDISYWYGRLQARIDNLVAYEGEDM